MRIDVVTVFPDYLRPLELSLIGKAIDRGQLQVGVHDLRDYTHDRHRTVDDAPYGGGPGMVMSPQPWGEALDAVLTDQAVLIIPTPSGQLFTQRVAEELATQQHLVFACGRYEGIDARVGQHYRRQVRELSIGDYVLAGGEAAVLVMCEAIGRLLPGVLGNPESARDDSHSRPDDLLKARSTPAAVPLPPLPSGAPARSPPPPRAGGPPRSLRPSPPAPPSWGRRPPLPPSVPRLPPPSPSSAWSAEDVSGVHERSPLLTCSPRAWSRCAGPSPKMSVERTKGPRY